MNLIELLFRISPDSGSGSTELIIGAALITLATAAWIRRPLGWR